MRRGNLWYSLVICARFGSTFHVRINWIVICLLRLFTPSTCNTDFNYNGIIILISFVINVCIYLLVIDTNVFHVISVLI
ncbi:hypothetical protein Gogos_015615 [Gossypium gossypioides]|uniref:Uncharacterized protein n=1 Tax=Gossypium gossypioides TaxID=34282 RepID=A0A7J9C272_GOSGO|nr:hypothetical protein [Gossypium gossypioides]MBA0742572.1 hypothetical protein [Gossypium gossypioides]